jgi:DNA-directed RNA polymerase specialized sigma24 family protein
MELNLNQTECDNVFRLLEPDVETLEQRFQRCRFKLLKFFAWRYCEDPDILADETIARLIKNVEAGQEISADNPYSYVYAIATNVFREFLRAKKKRGFTTDIAALKDVPAPIVEGNCKKECLEQLSPEKMELLARYYLDDEDREEIALEYGLSLNALRLQIYRIKLELKRCFDECDDRLDRKRN